MSQHLLTNHRKKLKALQGKLNQAIRFDKEADIENIWADAEAIISSMRTDGSLDWVHEQGSAKQFLDRTALYAVVDDLYWKEIYERIWEYHLTKALNS